MKYFLALYAEMLIRGNTVKQNCPDSGLLFKRHGHIYVCSLERSLPALTLSFICSFPARSHLNLCFGLGFLGWEGYLLLLFWGLFYSCPPFLWDRIMMWKCFPLTQELIIYVKVNSIILEAGSQYMSECFWEWFFLEMFTGIWDLK